MRMFLALISTPPPGLSFFLAPASVLVLTYLVVLHVGPILGVPTSPLVLAVAATIVVNASRSLPRQFRELDADEFVVGTVTTIVVATIAFLIWLDDPLWCQRLVTVILGTKALLIAHALWRDPDDLEPLGAPRSGPEWFVEDWARWKIVALGLTVLVNETAIRFANHAEWIAVTAILPALIYCLLYWTLTALAWSRLD